MTNEFTPDWYSFPGDTIKDVLEERKIPIEDFARQMGYTVEFIDVLLVGNFPITERIAIKLEQILGSTRTFWLNRQRLYEQARERLSSVTAS